MRIQNRMTRLLTISSALAVAAVLVSCGSPAGTADRDAAPRQAGVDVSLLRQAHNDYIPSPSPEHLVRTGEHDVIVAGEVETFLQGSEVPLQAGDEQPELFVLMKVRVTEEFRVRSAEQVNDGHVYVSLWQGPRFNDPEGTPEFSLADWNKSIPAGTRVTLFLRETNEGIRPGLDGVPATARPMAADVQGLILADGARLIGGIEELAGQWAEVGSMKELTDRIRQQVR